MAVSIRRGFALVGGLVALLEVISIAVLIAVAINGRHETTRAMNVLDHGTDIDAARRADAESEMDYWIIEALAIAEVVILLLGGVTIIYLLHRNVYRPLVDLDASIARYASASGERGHVTVSGPSEVRRIAATFNEMVDKVADQEKREAAFLAGIAHDIRNPLMVIRGSAEVLLSQETPARATVERACGRMMRQIERMEQMLSDFVDARGIESGMLELTPTDVDLAELARDVTDRFRAAAPAHELVVDTPPRPIAVRCDNLRLEQVLVNLISNAIKYSPGGGRVVVAAGDRGDTWVALSVSDHGIGIPRDQQAAIFEPFRRVAAASVGVAGSGLGLAVSKRIVERHGGRIEVDSEPGRGTTFRVLLPARAETAARAAQRA
ncbi:MAG TPA: HAMP domain-containing sensor histidine kinase [Kofleriaceae bacterium]|nr:HAMP domain-containing sensor histidine kinase [Kofleriaceae bacterium]